MEIKVGITSNKKSNELDIFLFTNDAWIFYLTNIIYIMENALNEYLIDNSISPRWIVTLRAMTK